jgi:DNA recombination protein RmuC
VDAVITAGEWLVPVDAKFPLENVRRMLETKLDAEAKAYQKAFAADVRRHIDDIAAKYILPDEGTLPFALMYVPAESVYYEAIIKNEAPADGGLYEAALERRVIPVSPNTLYAYLQVITLGLRGLQIEHRAEEIMGGLGRLAGELGKVREAFTTLGVHLENARKRYDDADKRLTGFETKLETVAGQGLVEGPAPLEIRAVS